MIIEFKNCSYKNKHLVGGKNASLGELYNISNELKFNIADGFAITTTFYSEFIKNNNIDELIEPIINNIDYDDFEQLNSSSQKIKDLFNTSVFTKKQMDMIINNFIKLKSNYSNEIQVAVR